MPKFPFGRKDQKIKKNEDTVEIEKGSGEEELSPAERQYLESFERSVNSPKPGKALYKQLRKASSLQPPQGTPDTTSMASEKQDPKRSYQNDPRYREFYDRLKRQQPAQQDAPSDYDEDPQPMSLEELERSGWTGTVQQPKLTPARPQPQRPTSPVKPQRETPAVQQKAPAAGDMSAGVVFKFDDDSVAVYKDAVSGKDYALFYFLEPNGLLAPRGIFLEQYEKQRIGKLPDDVLEQMWQSNRWDRDAVIFHLDKFEYATVIRRLETRTPAENYTRPQQSQQPAPAPRVAAAPEGPPTPAPVERDPLERGRVVRLNVAGKVWESVYWTKDEIGPIVAHDTNREWSLMHLDLSRFKDSIEYGELLDPEKLQEIEASLARNRQ